MAITYKQLTGPKQVPILGNLTQIDKDHLHKQVEDWSDEFGSVYKIKIGPMNVTVITDTEIIQEILRRRPDDFIRQSKMGNILNEAGAKGVFTAEGDDWRKERRIVARGLDVSHQKAYFPAIQKSLERLYHKWEKQAELNEVVAIQEDFMRFTVDVTTSLAFGIDMNTLEKEGGVIQDHMENIFPMIYKRINDPIPWYKIVRSKRDKEFDASVKELLKFVDGFIEEGKKRLERHPHLNQKPENFLDAILVAAKEEDGMTNEKITGNLLTLLLAGEDTTALSLTWAVYFLTAQPEYQELLAQEAETFMHDAVFLNDYDQHVHFKLAQAVANETMRLKPVAPFLLFEPTKDIEIKGYLFEKGARILTQSRYGAITEPNFSKASQFYPERWLENTGKCPFHNTDAHIPFGGGPRTCPGMNLALLEMKVVLSMLFKNFTVERDTSIEVDEIIAFTMKPSGFTVKLNKR